VLMQVEQDRIVFKATDLDIEVTDHVPAQVASKGSTTVPAHMLHDIVRKLPEGCQVVIEQTEAGIAVRAGRSRFTLQTLPETDFPNLSAGDVTHSFALAGKDLHRLIEKAQFAISTEETRYYLNGIYLHQAGPRPGSNKAQLRVVATDGHRLAQVEMEMPEGADGMVGVIVPRKTVGEVTRLFGADQEIQIELSQGKIRFTAGDVVLTSKLIDGTFPDYGRVIPQNNDKDIVIDRRDLSSAVDRVATISSERGRAVKVSLSAGKVVLSVSNPDSGTATEEMEADYAGEALDVGANSRYLADILAQVAGDVVKFKLADPGSPMLISGSDEGSLYVLMPMRC
ncbi:MAG: DNA polymerase III subunit beta, partial [Gemmatimonadaceae bacterium]|nr:DNA polymerase III subunit beta [Gemmatimonadaceae bacterium]